MHTPLPSQMLCLPIPPWYFLLVVKYYIPLKCLSGHLSRLASGFCSCVFPTSPSTTWPRSPAPAVEMTAPALLQRERGGVAPLRERKHCQMKIQGGPARASWKRVRRPALHLVLLYVRLYPWVCGHPDRTRQLCFSHRLHPSGSAPRLDSDRSTLQASPTSPWARAWAQRGEQLTGKCPAG